MTLSREEKSAVKKIITKVKEHFVIRQVILFGSKARHSETADSDIDILFLVEDIVNDSARWKLSDIVTEVEWKTEIYISCRLFNYLDWQTENEDVIFLPFKDSVVRDGELLEI